VVLVLSQSHLSAISDHAELVYPEECCGLMVGRMDAQADAVYKLLIELVPLDNQWTADQTANQTANQAQFTKRRRYSIAPTDMLSVQRQARDQGLNIIGVYHSHPDHVAEPSECDRALAWPDYAYVIVSVNGGKAVDIKNWALDSDHQFQAEAMRVSPSSSRDRMPVSA
jgi:proteasome lid subunit RPN8/RPN11